MSIKCSLSFPLSQKQKKVWNLIHEGLSVSAIATKLKTTRQYINQTRLTAKAKLSTTLLDVADVNDLQIIKLYPEKAVLLGYHPALNRKAIITYNSNHGIKLWYWHNNPEEITNENYLSQIRRYVLDIAQEQGIKLDKKETHPAKLAHNLFRKLVPEVTL